jgi:arsenate reductase
MHKRSGSYEALFSKRAKLFHQRKLGAEDLDEARYKSLLLEHYTFLKRPLLIWDDQIFIGSSKATVAQAAEAIETHD